MREIKVALVKAFTDDPQAGNPAGVVWEAEELTDQQMIRIAAEVGFSETAFVSPSSVADYRVRFFTPSQEMALCGHATIATFHVLSQLQPAFFTKQAEVEVTQETGAGVLRVRMNENGAVTMEQASPTFFVDQFERKQVAKLLDLEAEELSDRPLELVSTGTPKLIIPVKSLRILEKIKPNLSEMVDFCRQTPVRGFYPFTDETRFDSDFYARQFNPAAGVNEDPLTGVAAGALGAYAVKHRVLADKTRFVIEQGYLQAKPGKMTVEIIKDQVWAGGQAVVFGEKIVKVD